MLRIWMNSKHANLFLNYEPHGIKNRQASSINEEASRNTVISYRCEVTLECGYGCQGYGNVVDFAKMLTNSKVSWIFSWPEICTMFTVCYSLLSLFSNRVRKTMSGDWYNWSTYLMNSQDWTVGQRDSECIQVGKWWPMIFWETNTLWKRSALVFELTKIGSCAKFAINIILKNRSNSSSRFPLTDKFH